MAEDAPNIHLAAALAGHNKQLADEHRFLLELSKRIRIRLNRWMLSQDKDWKPTADFMGAYDKLARNVLRLIAEGRQLEKSRAADDLPDEELQTQLRPVVLEILRDMPEAERMLLVKEAGVDADGQHAEH